MSFIHETIAVKMLKKNGTSESVVATQLEKIQTGTNYASVITGNFLL